MCRRTSTKDPLRQPPNTRRRDKSQENCLQDICLCLLYTSYLKILCWSHVSDSCRSVHQYGPSTRFTSSDSCLNIFVSQAPLQDPCLWIHVSASMCISGSCARSMSVSRRRNANFDLRRRVLCGPAQRKQSDRVFRVGETQILTCRDAFFVARRRRNANLTSRDTSCVHIMWIHEESRPDERKSPRRYSETPKNLPSPRFAQAKRKL